MVPNLFLSNKEVDLIANQYIYPWSQKVTILIRSNFSCYKIRHFLVFLLFQILRYARAGECRILLCIWLDENS
jgi:hypothetical protein